MKRMLPLITILISLALLWPGVTLPILSIQGTIEKSQMAQAGFDHLATSLGSDKGSGMITMFSHMLGLNEIKGDVEVFNNTRSIWGTVEELYRSGNVPVALLIMLFSIIIPALKLSLMLVMQLPLAAKAQLGLAKFMQIIAKWSMADVFVVALIVSYMAGNASTGEQSLLQTKASFEVGFYYFAAYCIFSVLSSYFVGVKAKQIAKSQSVNTAPISRLS